MIHFSFSDTHKNEILSDMSSLSQSTIDSNIENDSFEENRYWVWLENAKKLIFEAKNGFLLTDKVGKGANNSDFVNNSSFNELGTETLILETKKGFLVADNVGKGANTVSKNPDSDFVNNSNFNEAGTKTLLFEPKKGFLLAVNTVSKDPDTDIVNACNFNKDYERRVVAKKVKKRENDEKFENLGASDHEADFESPENFVSCLSKFSTPDSDIFNDVNVFKDDLGRVVTKKAVTKGSKRVKREENDEKFGNLGASDEADSENIVSCLDEFRTDIVSNVNFSKDDVRRVVTKKLVTKGNKRVKREENDEKFGKLGAGDEAESESPENIVSCLDEFRTPDFDTVKNVNFNKDDLRRVVTNKAVTKGNKRAEKDENDREFDNLLVGDEAESKSPENIVSCLNEFSIPDFDIVNFIKDEPMRVVKNNVAINGPKRVKKEEKGKEFEKLGAGDTKSPKNIVSCSSVCTLDPNNVINVNANKKDLTRVVRKKVVTKGPKRLKREENDDTCSNEFRTSNSDIFNANKEDEMRVEKEKAVTKGPKRVKKDENDRELRSGQVSNEAEIERANTIELQNPGSDIDDTSAECDIKFNNNAGKEEKTESVVTKSRKRVQKEERSEELGKEEMDNEPKTESPKISVLSATEIQNLSSDIANTGASISIESECDASGVVAVENVTVDNNKANKEEKTVRVVKKKVVKKVMKKVLKKVKKEQPFKEKEKLGESELEAPNVIEFRNPNSDTASSLFSNLSGDKNHICKVDDMEIEKANSIDDACENVTDNINSNSNANKEENSVMVEKLGSEGGEIINGEKHEAESCDVSGVKRELTMTDDVILSAQMDALERRKRRRTQIFLGGLDKAAVEEDVRKVFQKIGELVEVTVKMNDKTGKNKGFAFLRYASAADAKKAVESSGKVKVFQKQCIVEFMKGNDTIYLGNIDKTWKNDDIVRLLQDAGVGKIDKVTTRPDPEKTECNCGYAFLELEAIRDAQITFGLLEKKSFLGNKKIRVEWAKQLSEADEEEMYKAQTVYAEYMPTSWDEEAVKNHFKMFGEIESVALARNLVTSKRKDFAFVNYKTREAALTCIKAYTYDSSHDENSKEVHIKVSLAKSTPKTKQVEHASTPVIKISNKKKPTTGQIVVQSKQLRNKTVSTNDELVQLLRAQASWRQPQTSSGIGSTGLDYTHSLPAMKRLGNPNYSDPRVYPRPLTDSAFPDLNRSVLYPDVRVQSLPHYHRQGLSHPSGLPYEVDAYFNRFQRSGGAASPGGDSGVYRRY